MPQLRAVLFDLDGVLVDSYEVWKALLVEAVAEFGGEPFDDAAFAEVWGQATDADVKRFLPRVPRADLDRFYGAHLSVHLGRTRATPGARAALLEVRARGLGHAVVTNASRETARLILAASALDVLVDVVYAADDVAQAKPAPDMVVAALARLGVAAAEAILVGDSRYDLEAGHAAGVRVVGLGLAADWSIASLVELPALLARL